jgi:hypothetical protein
MWILLMLAAATAMMRQDLIELAEDFLWPAPRTYAWGGTYPNASALWTRRADWMPDDTTPPGTLNDTVGWHWRAEGWDRQPLRPAVLYQKL